MINGYCFFSVLYLGMHFDTRQSLNIVQTFAIGLIGAVVGHKTDHMHGLAMTGLSMGMAAYSLYRAKQLKEQEVAKAKNNLVFMTSKRLWDIQITAGVIMSLPIMVNDPINWWGVTIAAGLMTNIGLMYKTEATVANNKLSFEELSDHPMIDDTALRSNVSKTALLDWLENHPDRHSVLYIEGALSQKSHALWNDRMHRLLDAGAFQNKDGHLSIAIRDRVFLEYKDNQYHWYGSPSSYASVMQKLLCIAIHGAVQDDPLKEVIEPRSMEVIAGQMETLSRYTKLSALEWWDSMLYNNGICLLPTQTSETPLLF